MKKILSFSLLTYFLNFIKFEHSVFALPFALCGALLANENNFPKISTILWIILAMVGARSLAMSLNRIIDKDIDLKNPRTKNRELPQEKISSNQAIAFSIISFLIFVYAALQLPKICILLLPIAAVWFLIYPYTKRFTFFSHLWLGVALGASVLAGWLACGGNSSSVIPYLLGIAVMFWVSGFDIIYACQDFDFDKKNKLHSIPAKFGIKNSLVISRLFHLLTVVFLILTGLMINPSLIYWIGVIFVAGMLFYEQSLVSKDDLSKVDMAFFTVNGLVSIGFFLFLVLEKLVPW